MESCVLVLDISKTFDRLWNASLFAMIPSFVFPPSLSLLKSCFFSDRFISVLLDGVISLSFFVLIVAFLKILFALQLYSNFSSMIFLASIPMLFIPMPITQLSIFNLLPPLPLDVLLVFSFPIHFLPIWM